MKRYDLGNIIIVIAVLFLVIGLLCSMTMPSGRQSVPVATEPGVYNNITIRTVEKEPQFTPCRGFSCEIELPALDELRKKGIDDPMHDIPASVKLHLKDRKSFSNDDILEAPIYSFHKTEPVTIKEELCQLKDIANVKLTIYDPQLSDSNSNRKEALAH